MKQILISFAFIIGLLGCKDKIVDNNSSLDLFYIKNSISDTIYYEIIGANKDYSKQLGYLLNGTIAPDSSKEVFKSIQVAVGGYGFDSLKIRNQNNKTLFKIAVPYPFSDKCKIDKIGESTSKWTLEINDSLINLNN